MKIIHCKQGGSNWLSARAGRITASRVVDVLNFRKDGKPGSDRLNYLAELVCERLTGKATDHYVSDAMEHGSETEQFARADYEVTTGNDVDQVGMVIHPAFDFFSCSPDGLVGEDGLVEFKAPTSITHYKWLLAGEVPEQHKAQVYSGMAICEREWGDFMSFDDRYPEELKWFIKRLPWDDAEIEKIESAVLQFNSEVEQMIANLRAKYGDFALPAAMAAKVEPEIGDLGISDEDIARAEAHLKAQTL